MKEDIRWLQRLDSFKKAFGQLESAVILAGRRPLSNLEKQGLIQAFEFTHELAWNTLKDFLESRGNREIYGSRDAVRDAFRYGLLENGETWMEMIKSRNKSSHTYNEKTAEEITTAICSSYCHAFEELIIKLSGIEEKEDWSDEIRPD